MLRFVRESIERDSVETLSDVLRVWKRMRSYSIALPYEIFSEETGGVSVFTAHQSKGLEFEAVFVPGLLDGVWGNRRVNDRLKLPETIAHSAGTIGTSENEEERRLFFVAVTRAKRILAMSFPESEKTQAKIPSEFVMETGIEPVRAEKTGSSEIERFLSACLSSRAGLLEKPMDEAELLYIRERLSDYKLSATDLSRFLSDPQEFLEGAILRYPFEDTPHTVFGKAYHSALESFFLDWKKTGEKPDKETLIQAFERSIRRSFLPPEFLADALERGRTGLSGWWDLQAPDSVLPKELEYGF